MKKKRNLNEEFMQKFGHFAWPSMEDYDRELIRYICEKQQEPGILHTSGFVEVAHTEETFHREEKEAIINEYDKMGYALDCAEGLTGYRTLSSERREELMKLTLKDLQEWIKNTPL